MARKYGSVGGGGAYTSRYDSTVLTWATTSDTDSSFESRTALDAEIDNPLPQRPSNPASSAIRADSPLCASIRKDRFFERTTERSVFAIANVLYCKATRRGKTEKAGIGDSFSIGCGAFFEGFDWLWNDWLWTLRVEAPGQLATRARGM